MPIDPTWDAPEGNLADVNTSVVKVAKKYADTMINTSAYGDLTFERFMQMKANNGDTNAALARALDVPVGTVSDWARRFRKAGCPA